MRMFRGQGGLSLASSRLWPFLKFKFQSRHSLVTFLSLDTVLPIELPQATNILGLLLPAKHLDSLYFHACLRSTPFIFLVYLYFLLKHCSIYHLLHVMMLSIRLLMFWFLLTCVDLLMAFVRKCFLSSLNALWIFSVSLSAAGCISISRTLTWGSGTTGLVDKWFTLTWG